MLRMMLRLRSTEKSKEASKINDVTLLLMESRFYFCSCKRRHDKLARANAWAAASKPRGGFYSGPTTSTRNVPRNLLRPWVELTRDRGRRFAVRRDQEQFVRLCMERHCPRPGFGFHRVDSSLITVIVPSPSQRGLPMKFNISDLMHCKRRCPTK
jgi:hypothetical protein